MNEMDEVITLDYGSGGKKTSELIEKLIVPKMNCEALSQLGDAAVIGDLVFSTDSFVVSPRFFPGGNIGKLAVCGTVNDISVAGGKPEYLSLSYIIEEGLPSEELERITSSVAETAEACGVSIVTGDTKVVERGRGDGIYINTAGIGRLITPGLGRDKLREGDIILISGTVGDHGTAVMLAREPGLLGAPILSDCAPLNRLTGALSALGHSLRVMRDPTRGGLATTLNEFIEPSPSAPTVLGMELDERSIPVNASVQSACDILGLDPLYCACEGRAIAVVAPEASDEALAIMKSFDKNAAVIGRVTAEHPGRLTIKTRLGGSRIAAKLTGAQLPRIC